MRPGQKKDYPYLIFRSEDGRNELVYEKRPSHYCYYQDDKLMWRKSADSGLFDYLWGLTEPTPDYYECLKYDIFRQFCEDCGFVVYTHINIE